MIEDALVYLVCLVNVALLVYLASPVTVNLLLCPAHLIMNGLLTKLTIMKTWQMRDKMAASLDVVNR